MTRNDETKLQTSAKEKQPYSSVQDWLNDISHLKSSVCLIVLLLLLLMLLFDTHII